MKVVVIIPTYNEKENIGRMLEILRKIARENSKYEFLTLVVDANSTDGTQEIVRDFMKKDESIFLLTGPKKGLGHDLIRGYRHAMRELGADVVIPNDADFQWDPNHIPKLLEKIDQGYDVVVASRHIKGGKAEQWGWFRKLNHWLANDFFAGLVAGVREVKDHSGCFKAIRVKGHLDKVDFDRLNVKGFVIQNEILYQLSKTKAKFAEVPVKFKERQRGVSKVGFNKQYLKDIFEWVKSCVLIRLERSRRFLKYATIGFVSYGITAFFLEIFYRLGLSPGPAASAASEIAIMFNFAMNNLWTFAEKRITGSKRIIWKFFQFNLTSLGAVILQGLVVGGLSWLFGDQWRQIYLVIAVGFFVIPYNYTMYNLFIWRTWKLPKIFR